MGTYVFWEFREAISQILGLKAGTAALSNGFVKIAVTSNFTREWNYTGDLSNGNNTKPFPFLGNNRNTPSIPLGSLPPLFDLKLV